MSPLNACSSQIAKERIVKENYKDFPSYCTEFEKDRVRILRSISFRRLSEKTQVLSLIEKFSSVRNRLTHSLEVAQIGRKIAGAIGCNQDIVEAACLVHDIGHPPFGHNGEYMLNKLSKNIGGFEANAQTLRILTRLESRFLDSKNNSVGLNLTRGILNASCKYPWEKNNAPNNKVQKFGVYKDDIKIFNWIRRYSKKRKICIEAEIMDLSDDIAYSIHDLEDGVLLGIIDLSLIKSDKHVRSIILRNTQKWFLNNSPIKNIEIALHNLESLLFWHSFKSIKAGLKHSEYSALMNMTSKLIERFSLSSIKANCHKDNEIFQNTGLIIPLKTKIEIAIMKGITATFIMSDKKRRPLYAYQHNIIKDLFYMLSKTGDKHLDTSFKENYQIAAFESKNQALRVIIDQIASLTDISAIALHKKLSKIT